MPVSPIRLEADMPKSKVRISEHVRLHVIVNGIVQGVNFRYYTTRQAQSLGLTGWVANRWDGAVEVVAEGARAPIQSLLDWLQHGPPSATVTDVEEKWEQATGEFAAFNVQYL
jgi:acylphosphatase